MAKQTKRTEEQVEKQIEALEVLNPEKNQNENQLNDFF